MLAKTLTSFLRLAIAVAIFGAPSPSRVEAGCGCDKPPPPPASVRPYVTYAGMPVTLFSSAFTVGDSYTVTFRSGITGESADVGGTVVSLRDLADGYYKPQIVVALPALPLGPASITVTRVGAMQPTMVIPDTAFTVASTPIAVPYRYGNWQYPAYQAAVDRNGVIYLSLDLTGVTTPLVIDAYMGGYPLRLTASDIVFRNVQGFLMQMLVNSSGQPVPGMFVLPPPTAADSNVLRYSRHEFSTYFLQHMERQPHAVDPTDGNWHLDGSRHVDHNHLILAISGKVNGFVPSPGATPAFNLMVKTYSLFYAGLTGTGSVAMSGGAATDSIDSNTNVPGLRGDVFTLGTLTMKAPSTIKGNATAKAFSVASTGAAITGTKSIATPTTFMAITVPTLLPSLGMISLSGSTAVRTIYGPGSFLVSSISLSKGALLLVDNTAGPVTLYVTGAVSISGATIQTVDPKPDKFAIYVAGTSNVTLSTTTSFNGVVYAPNSTVAISGSGNFTGAFLGKALTMGTYARVHYDSSLSGSF